MDFSDSLLFAGVSEEEYHRMMACFGAAVRRFQAGQTILDYHNSAGFFGVLETGRACLVRSDQEGSRTVLEWVLPGGVFGNMVAFAVSGNDSVWLESETESSVIFIPEEQITKRCENACEHHSKLVENLLQIMRQKALHLSERIEVLSRRSIREKLMIYFLLQQKKAGSARVELPFSYHELAQYICADRSAMMRELGKMQQEHLILRQKRTVLLLGESVWDAD